MLAVIVLICRSGTEAPRGLAAGDSAMMGRQDRDQGQLFYEFSLDEMIPTDHLLRRINVFATAVLSDLHQQLKGFYSDIGRSSVDPELMIRMLLVGYSRAPAVP